MPQVSFLILNKVVGFLWFFFLGGGGVVLLFFFFTQVDISIIYKQKEKNNFPFTLFFTDLFIDYHVRCLYSSVTNHLNSVNHLGFFPQICPFAAEC